MNSSSMQCWRKMRLLLLLGALAVQFAPVLGVPLHTKFGRDSSIIHEERLRRQEKVCSDPGTPTNGHRKPHEGGSYYRVGEEAIFVCNGGYTLEGHSLITCTLNSDGRPSWDYPTPQCIGESSAGNLQLLQAELAG